MDWLGLTLLLLAGLALAFLATVVLCAWQLTHPPRRGYAYAVSRGLPGTPQELPAAHWGPRGPRPWREWFHQSGRLRFPVWEITGESSEGSVIIVSHGWGESRVHGLLRLAALVPSASMVLLWDARGHGEAGGMCRLGTSEVDDLLSLIGAAAPAGRPVVLYGSSLGGGVSIAAGASGDVRAGAIAAIVAEAPYRLPRTPAERVMENAGYPARLVLPLALTLIGVVNGRGAGWWRAGFDRREFAARLSCPLLVLHGDQDAVCPLADGESIAAAAPHGQLSVVQGAGHLDLWTDEANRRRSVETVTRFLSTISSARAGTHSPELELRTPGT